jgi:hypothetical protein
MFRSYTVHLQVYHAYKMLKIIITILAFYIHDTPENGLYMTETCSVTRVQ